MFVLIEVCPEGPALPFDVASAALVAPGERPMVMESPAPQSGRDGAAPRLYALLNTQRWFNALSGNSV